MTEPELNADPRRALLAWDALLDCASRNLAATRKLSREVEQALRKIREGLSQFDDFWNKVMQAQVNTPCRALGLFPSARVRDPVDCTSAKFCSKLYMSFRLCGTSSS